MGRFRKYKLPEPGDEFGLWVVEAVRWDADRGYYWCDCRCKCGTRRPVKEGNLVRLLSLSCGCAPAKATGNRFRKHGGKLGGKASPEYTVWQGIKRRCLNKNEPRYPDYGGRGIMICERWKNSFENFLADVGYRPSGTQLERKDNNGHYEPGNCRWATRKEQARNKRNSRILIANDGSRRCLAEWAETIRLDGRIIQALIKRGATIDDIVSLTREIDSR